MLTQQKHNLELTAGEIIKRLNCELINAEHTDKLQNRATMPLVGDIVVAFFIDVTDLYGISETDTAIIPLTIDLAEQLHLTPYDSYRLAQKNIKGSCMPMSAVMHDLCPDITMEETSEPTGLFVISNDSKVRGASAILSPSVQNEIMVACNGPAWIIPSSTHELLACPTDLVDPTFITQMIYDINRAEVLPEDRLSDHLLKLENHHLSVVI